MGNENDSMTDKDALEVARKKLSFWKSEVSRLKLAIAAQGDGKFPRLAHVHDYDSKDLFRVVVGRLEQHGDISWPCIVVNRKTRKTKRMLTSTDYFGGARTVSDEPDWMSEADELALVNEFSKSKWARDITARS